MHIDVCLLICFLSALSINPSVCICLMNPILQLAVCGLNDRSMPVYFCVHACALTREINLESTEKRRESRQTIENKKGHKVLIESTACLLSFLYSQCMSGELNRMGVLHLSTCAITNSKMSAHLSSS